MKHAKILDESGNVFDWEEGQEAMNNVQREDGSVNWKAAANADPGVTSCPECKEYFWDEARYLECTECGAQFDSTTKELL